ncbi:MAG: NAD(P)-dependent oxidoreductase [Niabella sp.]|nr:NAD(P)-dependent oxidoreductase [Niabella sp.]
MKDIQTRYEGLLRPSARLIDDIRQLDGDILFLGVAGKMGPSMAALAVEAAALAGVNKKVYGVSRFSDPEAKTALEDKGVITITADLLKRDELFQLPDVKNVIYLAGTKFGTTGKEYLTWAMNSYLPGMVAEKYRQSRIVVFSTGNVYPLMPLSAGGATEQDVTGPVGEYAQSCLGRERVFEYGSATHGTELLIYRLNYANDVSYGVLLEIGKAVLAGTPVDLNMGHVNVIWQQDANEIAIRSLLHCSRPPKLLNVTGPETASVRWIAEEFGRLMGKQPVFTGQEQSTALLSNAGECFRLFGYPSVSLKEMIGLDAAWLLNGGKTLNKPTHFQEREGKF